MVFRAAGEFTGADLVVAQQLIEEELKHEVKHYRHVKCSQAYWVIPKNHHFVMSKNLCRGPS